VEPSKLEIDVERSVRPVVEKMGLEFVDAAVASEPAGAVLRVLLDRPGGIDLDTLTEATYNIRPLLEREVPEAERYRLEVSSPGIERPLRRRADFERFAGRQVFVRSSDKIGDRRNFTGRIERVEGDAVVVRADGETFAIPLDGIAKAHLVVEV